MVLYSAIRVHATLAGVLLALTVPLKRTPAMPEADPHDSPLHQLEMALIRPVAFVIMPIFGFADAGVSFTGLGGDALLAPVTMGVAAGLVAGKLTGIFGAVLILVRTGIVDLPAGASWPQMFGTTMLCGIGFTMSLFISMLAFSDVGQQNEAKIGILLGSLICGIVGYVVLHLAKREEVRDFVSETSA